MVARKHGCGLWIAAIAALILLISHATAQQCADGFTFTCSAGNFINAIKAYGDGTGYILIRLSCTDGTSFGQDQAIPAGTFSLDESGVGKYYNLQAKYTPNPYCHGSKQISMLDFTKWAPTSTRLPDGTMYNYMSESGYYCSLNINQLNWYSSWESLGCGSDEMYINSITSAARTPYWAGVSVTCASPFVVQSDTLEIRPLTNRTIPTSILFASSARVASAASVTWIYENADVYTQPLFGYFLVGGNRLVWGATFTSGDLQNGKVTFIHTAYAGNGQPSSSGSFSFVASH
ncbi:uncharacterized protein EV422DRAFT_166121 [Fimicolochytrium jonesii]|uniref:uncharacterized protein n=1 Tax=Fimicolochytrium jonesii TaxID=1396493 RepID=UPI0022FF3346|nr:uncharacterized protein EV422DRAFT_166121 [Fimicolochytrium jonesii]KAI8818812.1 hypothetical protein EV422DRAFT_166121 [Fimicolochytrium jonesii]